MFNLDFIIEATLASRILIQFLGQNVGLTILRKSQPNMKRPYKMWLYPIPSVIVFCGFTFIFISSGVAAIGVGLLWLLIGVIVFLAWAKKNNEWPFTSLQKDGERA